ncbi:hypothetical protein KIM372_04640 [Bombiscardovia nodaiensis]|uniref:Damage-inducible protein J n=1 Tax=Bombiscardovia nodaiensis TaxID=2932181 RepID=A0ABN6S8S0_9BIFI|nr:hypothetical protein KIM372_04640 [Bombiscardovia nodaiensis]
MTIATVTVRVDEETKREASRVVESLGLDLTAATRIFYKQIAREQRIPVSLDLQEDSIPRRTVDSIREAERIAQSGRSRYSGRDDFFEQIGLA